MLDAPALENHYDIFFAMTRMAVTSSLAAVRRRDKNSQISGDFQFQSAQQYQVHG